MEKSNTRSTIVGAVATTLPILGAMIGFASIAGVTGCHMEVLFIPLYLLGAGGAAAVLLGAVAIPLRRSKRGLIMPALAILAGLGALGLLVFQ